MASSKIIELDASNTCKLCDNALAKYMCPKCNISYCSLNCYQSDRHLSCSEQFYKDNVFEELQLNENNPKSKSIMLDILKKIHESNPLINDCTQQDDDSESLDSDDAPEMEDIADRLANVDLDDAETVWKHLTDDERKDFVAFLQSEDVTKLVPSWQPWWSFYNDSKILEVDSATEDYKKLCPTLVDLQKFKGICKKEPTQSVKYNLINILSGYAFTTRYFNGEYAEFAREASSCIGTIALGLNTHQEFESFETAVKSVEQECINSDWITADTENFANMQNDIEKILKGPTKLEPSYYILCFLSDLHSLLKTALEKKEATVEGSFSRRFPNSHFPEVIMHTPNKIKAYIKRVEYFLSYAQNFSVI